jgi:hypothetical protein
MWQERTEVADSLGGDSARSDHMKNTGVNPSKDRVLTMRRLESCASGAGEGAFLVTCGAKWGANPSLKQESLKTTDAHNFSILLKP